MAPLVIIGNGITGTTVARHVRKHDDRPITIISDESQHLYSRPALMYIYMGHITYENTKPYEDWFWEKNKLDLVFGRVGKIDTEKNQLTLYDGRHLEYGQLVIATGSVSNKFGWPGQDLEGVQGFYTLQDLELMEKNTRGISRAVIVGGGLIGIEVAEMLHSRHIPVTMLVREKNYWDNILPLEEAQLISRHVQEHGIDLRLATQLKEIKSDDRGRARAVVTDRGDEIACGFVALTAGVKPNTDIVKDSPIESKRGILVNEFLETNVPDIFAAGDCAEFRVDRVRHPRVEQLWYTGRMQAEALAKTLCGERMPYDRGIWFNSAKFFDIEYQTYGMVSNVPLDGETSLYWEHADGTRCVRIVYDAKDSIVIGFNIFGIRYRQEVCERWLAEKRTVGFVLEHLGEANFDPEFFRQFESDVVAQYNRLSGENLSLKKRRGLFRRSA